MINKIKSIDRHFSDMGWLKTYWLFSFSSYYDPKNVSHGILDVYKTLLRNYPPHVRKFGWCQIRRHRNV